MVRDGDVFLVDFDQFCLADPALDVGYFLAYLRPAGLWYHRAGRRAWFARPRNVPHRVPRAASPSGGRSAAACAGIAGRARSTRPPCAQDRGAAGQPAAQPPPREVAGVLDEAAGLLN